MHANFDDDDANVLDDNDDVWSGWPFLKLFGGQGKLAQIIAKL